MKTKIIFSITRILFLCVATMVLVSCVAPISTESYPTAYKPSRVKVGLDKQRVFEFVGGVRFRRLDDNKYVFFRREQLAFFVFLPPLGAVIPVLPLPAQCYWLEITFDANDRVQALASNYDFDKDLSVQGPQGVPDYCALTNGGSDLLLISPYKRSLSPARDKLLLQARSGQAEDPDVYYQAFRAFGATRDERLKWLCIAAHKGHFGAQRSLSEVYNNAFFGLDADRVESYKWASLVLDTAPESKRGGRVRAMNNLTAHMTPAQIADAERLVREWKPDPESCEALAEQTSSSQ